MASSGMRSITITTGPTRLAPTLVSLVYPSSKAALNVVTTPYAKALPRFRVNAVAPITPPRASTATAARRPSSTAPR